MPFGVSKHFLDLTERTQRRALVTLGLLTLATGLELAVAELLDPGRMGGFVALFTGTLLAGLLLGALGGYLEVRSWGESLKASWQGWMSAAHGAGSMGEAAGRAGAAHVRGGLLLAAVLVGLNAAVLVAAWSQLPPLTLTEPYGALAVVAVGATGLAIGARATVVVAEAWWCRSVRRQTLDLVQQGRIGVWGIR